MWPNINHGDYVLTLKLPKITVKVDDMVVVNHSEYRVIVKRVKCIDAKGTMLLAGDNIQSTSSQAIGWVSKHALLGRVILHIPKPLL